MLQVRCAKNRAKPQGAASQTPIRDNIGQWVWRLRQPRIIRRNIAYPTNSNQGFYYNLLLDNVPFRGDRELLPEGSDYFTECIRRGVFRSTPQLDQHLQAYARYNLYQQITLDKLRARVATSCSDHALHALGTPNQPDGNEGADPDSDSACLRAAEAQQQLLRSQGAGFYGQEAAEVDAGMAQEKAVQRQPNVFSGTSASALCNMPCNLSCSNTSIVIHLHRHFISFHAPAKPA
jgi:hypothetical protein